MKKLNKIIITMIIIVTLIVTQIITAFAYYDRVCDLTSEELFDTVWDMYYFDNFQSFEDEDNEALALEVSITRVELKNFLADYEPINKDVNVSDVEKEYYQYLQDVVFKDIEMSVDEDGNIYEYQKDNPDEKNYWAYNESSDKFVCTDSDNKVIKSYDRFYPENDKSSSSSSKSSKAHSSSVSSKENKSKKTTVITTTIADNASIPATSDTAQTDSNKLSPIQMIVLSVISIMIVIGIVFISFLAAKRRKVK